MSLQLVWVIAPNTGFNAPPAAQGDEATPIRPSFEENTPSSYLAHLLNILSEESIVACQYLESLSEAGQQIETELPDLILMMADPLEAVGESVNTFCQELRSLGMEYRPVVVIQTGATDPEKRIEYLISGADDTLSHELSVEELRIRLLVHLRRNLDVLSNRITRLPGRGLSTKMFQRRINRQEPWGLLLMSLEHWEEYVEVYGQGPGEQVLKTFSAMLGAIIIPPDFIGHNDTHTFMVLTQATQAEKLAQHLCRQFDSVSPNFYSKPDRERGYIVSLVDERVSRRVRFLSLAIGIVTSGTHAVDSYKQAYSLANEMRRLAEMMDLTQAGSHWSSERLRLSSPSLPAKDDKRRAQAGVPEPCNILVVESDAAMAFLLKATLEMQGYHVETTSSPKTAREELALYMTRGTPIPLVLLDSVLNGEESGWELCELIKQHYPTTAVIFLSTIDNRDKALNAGADLYLPKPFELMPLFTWVNRLLKG